MLKLSLVFFCVVAALSLARPADEKYSDADFANFNFSELLDNERLLQNYIKCLLDEGPCTPEVKKLRERIEEVLETNCAKCTDRQKEIGKKMIPAIKEKYPELWSKLLAKYDPEGKYQAAFTDIVKE